MCITQGNYLKTLLYTCEKSVVKRDVPCCLYVNTLTVHHYVSTLPPQMLCALFAWNLIITGGWTATMLTI